MTKDGEVYVYKRSDGRWEARYTKKYTQGGKPVRGSVYGKSRAEVVRKRKKLLEQADTEAMRKDSMRLNLLILGAGSHGQNIKEIAEQLKVFYKISFLDDAVTGEEVIGKFEDATTLRDKYACAFVALGDNKKRKKWTRFLKKENFMIPNIISPSASVSPKAVIGEGVAILSQSTVNESVIGDFCILASNCVVNNGAKIGNFSHIDCGGIVKKEADVPAGTWVKTGKVFTGGRKKADPEINTDSKTDT